MKKLRILFTQSKASTASLGILAGVNILTVIFAVQMQWQFAEIALLFWSQNIIIGAFALLKIITSPQISFSKDEMTSLGRVGWGIVFGIKFLFFHGIYLLFFRDFMEIGKTFGLILPGILLFLGNHALSFFLNARADHETPVSYTQFTELVFLRILPIHLFITLGIGTLFLGSFLFFGITWALGITEVNQEIVGAAMLIIFILLKAFFELVSHAAQHADPQLLKELRRSSYFKVYLPKA